MKELVRKIARRFGVEISRYRPENSDMAKLQRMLSYHQIDIVLDVGANIGQFATLIHEVLQAAIRDY